MAYLLLILLERGLKMGIRSYDIMYLDNVSANIGMMFEYAVSCGIAPKTYWNMFITSEVAKQIERGHPRFLAGYSAIELFRQVVNDYPVNEDILKTKSFFTRSKYYWAGWALAHYQNIKVASFYNISKKLPIEKVLDLYDTLHEADITKFFTIADEYVCANSKETNLKRIRTAASLSQKQLADKAEVSIRNIQMYEQRQNDINKAQADILFRLSKTLCCNMEDLFEIK